MTKKPISSNKETESRRTTARKPAAPAAAGDEPSEEAVEVTADAADPPPKETVEATAGPADPPPKLQRSSSAPKAFLWTVVIVAFFGGAVYATEPFWSPYVGRFLPDSFKDPIADPRVGGLTNRVAALEDLARARADTGNVIEDLERERIRSSERLDELMKRIDSHEKALDSVKKMIAATTLPSVVEDTSESLRQFNERLNRLEKAGDTLDDVSQRISRLERDVADTATATATATENVDLKELEARNRKLNTAVNELAQRLSAMAIAENSLDKSAIEGRTVVLSVGQLREALRTSGPFAKELAAVEAVAGNHADATKAIAELQPLATTGIPTLESLRRRFEQTAREVIQASLGLEGSGWKERAGRWFSSLVTVRRTADNTGGDGTDAVIARAETHLDAGDLIAATEILGALDGAPAAAADAWLADARSRLAAEQAIAKLHIFAISLLEPS